MCTLSICPQVERRGIPPVRRGTLARPASCANATTMNGKDAKRVAIYCGSSDTVSNSKYKDAASELGAEMARRNYSLVYGSGKTGLMGAVAKRVSEAGCSVTGYLPRVFADPDGSSLDTFGNLVMVESLHERKAMFCANSDMIVALPGGLGTLDELVEALSWNQIGLISKPVGLLNTLGFFDHLLRWIRHAVDEGFLHQRFYDAIIVDDNVSSLLDRMEQYQPAQPLLTSLLNQNIDSIV